ncbi:MurR/RpiR family transcriptional regulator [Vagococcus salmoninarum]|nr:MurR/RpiR family transcriptional regulator [Vagococcus salmoninarum]
MKKMFEMDKLKTATELDSEIAKYIMTNIEKVAFMRVRELADATHVSPATIVRFTQKMGFSSFPELRVMVKQELAKRKEIHGESQGQQELLSLDVFPVDFSEKVDRLVERLLKADFIHCIGLGASGIMAEYAARQFSTLGYRSFASTSTYFPYLAPKKEGELDSKEVCLIFSVSGETIEIVHIAKLLETSPIYTVSITNREQNTLSKTTDLDIYYRTSYDRVYYNADLSSQLPVVYFIEKVVKKLYMFEN